MKLINEISDIEMDMIDEYRRTYAGYEASSKYVLREWDSSKSSWLYPLLGNKLIVSKDIQYHCPIEELAEEFYLQMWREKDSPIHKFKVELDRFLWDNRQALGDAYINILDLMHDEVLATNAYNGEMFVVNKADGHEIKIQKGAKPVRMLQKIIKGYPDYEFHGLQEFINAHSVIMTKAVLKGRLCISIHPLDYMTMSDNEYDWDSCMSWRNEGCYRQGTVEMMNSNCVVVAYLTSNNDEVTMDIGDGVWNSKKWRQLFIVDKKFIAGIKCYPYQCDDLTKMVIEWLRELATQNMGWSYDPEILTSHEFYLSHKNGCRVIPLTTYMYNDFGYTTHFYIFSDTESILDNYHYNYSGYAECMSCGALCEEGDLHDSKCLLCPSCSNEAVCDHCDEWFEKDELVELDGMMLCPRCYEDYSIYDEMSDNNHHDDYFADIYIVPNCVGEITEWKSEYRMFNSFRTADHKFKQVWDCYINSDCHVINQFYSQIHYIYESEIIDLANFYETFKYSYFDGYDSFESFCEENDYKTLN